MIRSHVLLLRADDLAAADDRLAPRLTRDVIEAAVADVPAELLLDPLFATGAPTLEAARARYVTYLRTRLREPRAWLAEALAAQSAVRLDPPQRKRARR
jgi:hypothetical protein